MIVKQIRLDDTGGLGVITNILTPPVHLSLQMFNPQYAIDRRATTDSVA